MEEVSEMKGGEGQKCPKKSQNPPKDCDRGAKIVPKMLNIYIFTGLGQYPNPTLSHCFILIKFPFPQHTHKSFPSNIFLIFYTV